MKTIDELDEACALSDYLRYINIKQELEENYTGKEMIKPMSDIILRWYDEADGEKRNDSRLAELLDNDISAVAMGDIVNMKTKKPSRGIAVAIGLAMGVSEDDMQRLVICSKDASIYPDGELEEEIVRYVTEYEDMHGKKPSYIEVKNHIRDVFGRPIVEK